MIVFPHMCFKGSRIPKRSIRYRPHDTRMASARGRVDSKLVTTHDMTRAVLVLCKRLSILVTERWAGADPGVQAVSMLVILPVVGCHYFPPGLRSADHHRPLAGTKLYCLVTEAHRCEQLSIDGLQLSLYCMNINKK